VAGAHLVDRAGGTVTDLDGDPWRHGAGGLVASNGVAHDRLPRGPQMTPAARSCARVASS
jgi:fructose-1,6-bisphosphatase/inositol monophosphatase family enzyme